MICTDTIIAFACTYLHGSLHAFGLLIPPPEEEGRLHVDELLGGILHQRAHHGVQDVLHARHLDVVLRCIESQ